MGLFDKLKDLFKMEPETEEEDLELQDEGSVLQEKKVTPRQTEAREAEPAAAERASGQVKEDDESELRSRRESERAKAEEKARKDEAERLKAEEKARKEEEAKARREEAERAKAEEKARKEEEKARKREEKQKAKENYKENSNAALNAICNALSPYSYSSSKELEVLELYVVKPADSTQVEWADAQFVTELKARLHEECIDAVKKIIVHSLEYEELRDLMGGGLQLRAIISDRLYYRTHRFMREAEEKDVSFKPAWLVCIKGEEYVKSPVYALETGKKEWHIGRQEHPGLMLTNDIVIKDDCTSISRQHASIIAEGGKYYLKCKPGGCRSQGGQVTKIIRASSGKAEELLTLSHRHKGPLHEGDIVQLAHRVMYQFTYNQP